MGNVNFSPPATSLTHSVVSTPSGSVSGGKPFALTPAGKIPSSLATSPPQYCTGIVTSGGSITAGTLFSVVHTGTGVYTVTFTTVFAVAPVVLVSIIDAGAGTYEAPVLSTAPTTSGFAVTFRNNVGTATDVAWNFLAYNLQ